MVRRTSMIVTVALTLGIFAPVAHPQGPTPETTWSQEDSLRIQQQVQKKLLGLTTYGVFDWLTFGIHGKTLVLGGYASRPILKSDAERAVKGISGIDKIDNQIEVLPLSPNDDRLRAAVYNRIYSTSSLRIYNANAGRVSNNTVARTAGGITNDPPLGFHGIHIILKNGNVTLYGVVNSQGDSAIAGMQANQTPGTFTVTNDLIVAGAPPKKAK
jgi:hyperosmotically inducible periplasmic protein